MEENDTRQQALKVIFGSNLSTFDKKLWRMFLSVADDEDIMPIIELLEKDGEEGIRILTANFRSKFMSMTIGNQQLLGRIVENEVEFFTQKKKENLPTETQSQPN